MLWIGQFGIQNILQVDTGNKFKGEVLRIVESAGITLIHGRPQHPITKGLIEQANAVLSTKPETEVAS